MSVYPADFGTSGLLRLQACRIGLQSVLQTLNEPIDFRLELQSDGRSAAISVSQHARSLRGSRLRATRRGGSAIRWPSTATLPTTVSIGSRSPASRLQVSRYKWRAVGESIFNLVEAQRHIFLLLCSPSQRRTKALNECHPTAQDVYLMAMSIICRNGEQLFCGLAVIRRHLRGLADELRLDLQAHVAARTANSRSAAMH